MLNRRALNGVGAFIAGFVVVIVFGKVVFPGLADTPVVPNGLYLQGLVVGLLYALLAIGLVLVYRTNRIINFAQGELGAFAAVMAAELFSVYSVPYIFAVLAGLVAAVMSSLIVEFLIIRRFKKAPRLILTVVTIGVAQILGGLELLIPSLLEKNATSQQFSTKLQSPWGLNFSFGGVNFTADHFVVLVVGPAVLVGVALFFRFTRYGIAARGAAENAERARLLGIPVSRVSLIVWALAGLFSAVTAILRAPILGFQLGAIAGQGLMLRALAAAVIARMESLPIAVIAALVITMAEQTLFFSFGRAGVADGFLLIVIIVALLLQTNRLGRVDQGASTWRAVQEIRRTPRELRVVPEVQIGRGVVLGLVGLLVVVPPFFLSAANTSLASAILIYAMVGVSLVMLTGWSGNVSLGHWALVGIGAMVAGKLVTRVIAPASPPNFFVVLIVAGLCGAVAALLIGLPALRIRGLFLGVTTLAFAVTAHSWILQWEIIKPVGAIIRPKLFGSIDITSEFAFYYVCVAGLLLALYAGRNLRRTRLGRSFIALRDNEMHAQAFGVRPISAKLSAFALSGFFAALAGGLLAYHQQSLRYDRFTPEISLAIFAMIVIGGMGSMTGAVIGAVCVKSIQFYLPNEYQFLATGFGMLVLLMVFPGGLGEIVFRFRDRALRRFADMRKIVVPSLVADRRVEPAEPAELVGAGDVP
jgi:ABC-type branched-subunit amino acid transport system permease subunit